MELLLSNLYISHIRSKKDTNIYNKEQFEVPNREAVLPCWNPMEKKLEVLAFTCDCLLMLVNVNEQTARASGSSAPEISTATGTKWWDSFGLKHTCGYSPGFLCCIRYVCGQTSIVQWNTHIEQLAMMALIAACHERLFYSWAHG